MIEIFTVDTALKTILKRKPLNLQSYPAPILERTSRVFGEGVMPSQAVAKILASVADQGDVALQHWSTVLDGADLKAFSLAAPSFEAAYQNLPEGLREALQVAVERIRRFHKLQPLPEWETRSLGGRLGQRITALERVGIYVPGGTAPLPSSLLMSVIPAQVAGVRSIIVCTPPNPDISIQSAAHVCGLERIYTIGGAQAIAAMAFGTESIPRVDKIVGAGNLFVTLAKQQVYGIVGLDGLAGPTETVIIADHSARPEWVAADLLAQAEHDVLASAILLTPDEPLAKAVQIQVAKQVEALSRSEVIEQSMKQRGGIVITPDLESAATLASDYAPEHLCLSVTEPQSLAKRIRHAGGIFLGEGSFEVLGDYVAGPSHVMPTGGTARFASPLNVLDFVKITSMVALDEATSRTLSPIAARIARAEQLSAHASAADFRGGE